MNLRDAAKKKQEQKQAAPLFAKAKAKKKSSGGISKADAKKEASRITQESKKGLATLAAAKRERNKLVSKDDFLSNGIKYHNCIQHDGYWTVDITNGTDTRTAHNLFGSWMIGEPKRGEPQTELRTEIVRNVHTRWLQELSARSIKRRLPGDPIPKKKPDSKADKEKTEPKKENPWTKKLKAKKK